MGDALSSPARTKYKEYLQMFSISYWLLINLFIINYRKMKILYNRGRLARRVTGKFPGASLIKMFFGAPILEFCR
jgi:hypothetical protein